MNRGLLLHNRGLVESEARHEEPMLREAGSSKLLTEFHSKSELWVSAGGRETSPLRAYAFKTTWTHLRSQLREVQNNSYVKNISLEKTDQASRTAALLSSVGFQTEEIL
ncbi:hypothetical protein MHYP_G00022560 [Metynnis hypsauchen]